MVIENSNWLGLSRASVHTLISFVISAALTVNEIDELFISASPREVEPKLHNVNGDNFAQAIGDLSTYDDLTLAIGLSQTVKALAIDATVARTGRKLGGYSPLLKALEPYEYIISEVRRHDGFMLAELWVEQPSNPIEVQELKTVLEHFALAYWFDDGLEVLTHSNLRLNTASLLPTDILIDRYA